MKASELCVKSVAELQESLLIIRREQFNLNMAKATGQLAQIHLLKQVRRDIARIKTVIGQQESAA